MEPSNIDRAFRAATALTHYPAPEPGDLAQCAQDLITDLGHYLMTLEGASTDETVRLMKCALFAFETET